MSTMSWTLDPQPPVIWSVAGSDSGGGAGLSADGRAAAAWGVHLCPVVAAVTAQNSLGAAAVFALSAEQIDAQLRALRMDMRPAVIKTGLLGSVAAIEALCRCIDMLRRDAPVLLVVDPVLGATAGGAAFADAPLIDAYRRELLPRCDLLTPNRREARLLLGADSEGCDVPALARRLRSLGAASVCITGGDDAAPHDLALDWLDGPQGQGWLALPRLPQAHHHGSGCTFATAAAGGLARGFAMADAVVLAKMLTWAAVRDGHAAGAGAGPVRASAGFVFDRAALPVASFGDESAVARWGQVLRAEPSMAQMAQMGIYAITSDPARVAALAAAGVAHIQLRIKGVEGLSEAIAAALAAVKNTASQLWINDHAQLALAGGATALHLGQEDWAALHPTEREALLASGLRLGVSSHSLWELARARGLNPHYIACGPIWPTTTKAMPWRPQGINNLAWWVRMAGHPVLAIGGLLTPEQVRACAATGAAGACLVRALDGAVEHSALRRFNEAWLQGRGDAAPPLLPPRPSLG